MALPVRAASGVWSREFEHALVFANPGCSKCSKAPVKIQLPSSSSRHYQEVFGQESLLQHGGRVVVLEVSAAAVLLKPPKMLAPHGSLPQKTAEDRG